MDQRFPPALRLRRQNDIDAAYKKGRRVSGRFLRLHVRPNGLERSRLAVSVPKRICPTAVDRNRWKRLIRESFRTNKEKIGPGLDIVAVPSRPPGDLKKADVESALVQMLQKGPRA